MTLFENKTQSKILENLKVDENILNHKYMKNPGMGIDLLEALYTYVSPEELIKYPKAFGISKQQINKLKVWLDNNCHMYETMKQVGQGYQYVARAIFDTGSWGILTKIRRQLIDWEPQVTPDGKIIYERLDWLERPDIIFKNEDSIVLRREGRYISTKERSSLNDEFKTKDTFYSKQLIVYKLENNLWRKARIDEKLELIDAIEVMEQLNVS